MITQPSVSTFLRKTARHLRMKRNEDKEVQDFQGFPIGGSRRLPPLALVNWKNGHVFSRVAAGRSVSHLRNHFKNSRRLPTSVDEKTKNNSEKWFYLRFLPRTFICLTIKRNGNLKILRFAVVPHRATEKYRLWRSRTEKKVTFFPGSASVDQFHIYKLLIRE